MAGFLAGPHEFPRDISGFKLRDVTGCDGVRGTKLHYTLIFSLKKKINQTKQKP